MVARIDYCANDDERRRGLMRAASVASESESGIGSAERKDLRYCCSRFQALSTDCCPCLRRRTEDLSTALPGLMPFKDQ